MSSQLQQEPAAAKEKRVRGPQRPRANQPVSDRGLPRKEAAMVLGCSEKRLANLASLNQGPPYRRYRNRCFYMESELLAWMKKMPVHGEGQKEQLRGGSDNAGQPAVA
jgi:hypothetical protein